LVDEAAVQRGRIASVDAPVEQGALKAGLGRRAAVGAARVIEARELLVPRAHRVPGTEDDVPTMDQVLTMATVGGARTTAFGDRLGTLDVGIAADLVLLDWQQISFPYLDDETPVLDAVT